MSRSPDSQTSYSGLEARNLGPSIGARTRQMAARADVNTALSSEAPLRERLASCTDALVRHLDAACARIWLVSKDGRTLVLQANSGAPSVPGGDEPHVPVASPILRIITEEAVPYITADAMNDPNLKRSDWTSVGKMAYAGFPLRIGARVIGVLAMFSRRSIDEATPGTLRTISDMIAQAVERSNRDKVSDGRGRPSSEALRLASLFSEIRHVIDRSGASMDRSADMQVIRDRYLLLSRREREVMALVVAGSLNKQVGDQLGISEITVKAHRGQVMQKMRASSFADLVKIAVLLQLAPLS